MSKYRGGFIQTSESTIFIIQKYKRSNMSGYAWYTLH